MDYKGVCALYPSGVVPRITRQGGVFSIHSDPKLPLEKSSECLKGLRKLVIAEGYRKTLLAQLAFFGVHAASLFPDLDGLSAHTNWGVESLEYWKRPF
jgi:hypothetical protein